MSTQSEAVNRKVPIAIAAVLAVLVAAVAVWFFFIRDDSPAEFDIGSAADAAETDSPEDVVVDDPDAPIDPDGAWTVDSEFVADDGTRSEAGYRVDEVLQVAGQSTAQTVVGRTADVTGTISIEGTKLTQARFEVQMSTVETDDSRRDGRFRSALAVSDFPTAVFELTSPADFGEVPNPGETVSTTIEGEMTIHGVTKTVELTMDAVITNGRLVVVGSTPVVFTDYEVTKPTAAIVVSLDDEGVIEFQLFMTKV